MKYDHVPEELKERRQWIVWKLVNRDGRDTKIPFQPNGVAARSDDPSTWSTFEDVVKVAHKFSGIGYVFSAGDPYCGIDFDSCYDPDTQEVAHWAAHWVQKLWSYSEISPSGTGIKVWIRGKFPFGNGKNVKLKNEPAIKGKAAGIECYDHGRYFAVTGEILEDLSAKCEERQEIMDELYEHFFAGPDAPGRSLVVSAPSVIDRARKYLSKIPGAISGEAGHNQTFKAACVLILGFSLNQAEALDLLKEWNTTCQPPWSEKELLHKVESADKQAGDRGYMLRSNEGEEPPIPDYYEPDKYSGFPRLAVDNTYLTEEERERLAIQEESGTTSHAFMSTQEGFYTLIIPEYAVKLEVDRLRRESNELIGEVCVRCGLPGVRSYDGAVSIADLNLSSARARKDRAQILSQMTNFGPKEDHIHWITILEEFCQRVILKEREGAAAVDLRRIERGDSNDVIRIAGMWIPRRHPTILFGDGGGAKSYTALYLAGLMAQDGMRVALFDWELAGEDHRDRLEFLFPGEMPMITYARCERPLIHEVDRLRRIVKEGEIEYCFYDSIAFACSGPPESAEIASAYFRAVRQIGGGSTHIAHVSKAEGADQKPFGSAFWHNGARQTWYIKAQEDQINENILMLGLFNRKSNIGRIQKAVGFRVEFQEFRTYFTPDNPADTPELAEALTLSQRMREVLKRGPLTPEELSAATGAPLKEINRRAKRNTKLFVVTPDKRIANVSFERY